MRLIQSIAFARTLGLTLGLSLSIAAFSETGLAQTESAPLLQIQEHATPFPGSTLYLPNDGLPHPGIVVLHGSEGGSLAYFKLEAQLLASHGYAVLAYCWYNCAKNPITSPFSALENVELNNTIGALKWLRKSAAVGGKKIALTGFSRGAEQAILLASLPETTGVIDAIAVHSPSDIVVNGFNWASLDKRCWICATPNVACFKDSQDPHQWDWRNMRWNPACGAEPKHMAKNNAWVLNGVALKTGSIIEIEKFKRPVFITVGDKDEVWDFSKSVNIADRLKAFGESIELHTFPGERHNFSTANENIRHEYLLKFLKANL